MTATAPDLVRALGERGVRLTSAGGRLLIDAPKGVLTDADRRAMAEHKPELLALLTPPVPSVTPSPLDKLVGPRRTPWGTLVWSDPGEPAIELFGPC
jgi:hypothetical protein